MNTEESFKFLIGSDASDDEYDIEVYQVENGKEQVVFTLYTKEDKLFIVLSTHEGVDVHIPVDSFEKLFLLAKQKILDKKKDWIEMLELHPSLRRK